MTIPRYLALKRHWQKYPPLSRLAAWHFGFGKDVAPTAPEQDFEAFYRATCDTPS